MKVEIDENGVMVVTPETTKEDKELNNWYKTNGTKETRRVILFNRK